MEGRWWFGSYDMCTGNGPCGGDRPREILTSTAFTVQHNEIIFLISGGADPKSTYVSLEVEGREVHREQREG